MTSRNPPKGPKLLSAFGSRLSKQIDSPSIKKKFFPPQLEENCKIIQQNNTD